MFWKRRKALERHVGFEYMNDDLYFDSDRLISKVNILEKRIWEQHKMLTELADYLELEHVSKEAERYFRKKDAKKGE